MVFENISSDRIITAKSPNCGTYELMNRLGRSTLANSIKTSTRLEVVNSIMCTYITLSIAFEDGEIIYKKNVYMLAVAQGGTKLNMGRSQNDFE